MSYSQVAVTVPPGPEEVQPSPAVAEQLVPEQLTLPPSGQEAVQVLAKARAKFGVSSKRELAATKVIHEESITFFQFLFVDLTSFKE